MSVTVPIVPVDVPPDTPKVTVEPPVVSRLPAASRTVSVKVALLPDATVEGLDDIVDVAVEIAPGVTVIVGKVELIVEPLICAAICFAVPFSTPVKVAV